MTSRSPSRKGPRSSASERPFSGGARLALLFDRALSARESPADKRESPGGERSRMNVSPLDLRQQRFRAAFRGFDRIEVTSFLAAVADDYEQALRETDRLKQDLSSMEAALNEHREHDKNLFHRPRHSDQPGAADLDPSTLLGVTRRGAAAFKASPDS